ncbi:hypothetical protein [Chondromyces apiculatus]|uniref:Lipoprotein n=1 Tax=Chondromyces apiculatus DSM 436 TaxID=1192034 RepID=A0A017T324_9BACT|nr:hypothetical protein [Chondromyces apiculatus]EYF03639.1 Hypothetical protein CAP_5430 [Chondromyces apiculatus DSM 436]
MLRPLPFASLLLLLAASAASCGGAPTAAQPPQKPPTPTSVTRDNPGGDSSDPEYAALERLLKEPWGHRKDRFNTIEVPMPDVKKWRRVRIWSHPTRATFRYGNDHYAVSTVLYTPIVGRDDLDACLDDFWKKNIPLADAYGVRLGQTRLVRTTQDIDGEVRPVLIKVVDGSVDSVFASDDYVGAVSVYQSWPGTCLVHAIAFKASTHRKLAESVRDRWVSEGAPKLHWLKKVTEAPEFKAR